MRRIKGEVARNWEVLVRESESGCKKSESGCKKSESGCKGVRQAKTMIVTPFDQAWEMIKSVPVIVGHVVTITREENKVDGEMSKTDRKN